MAKVIELAKIKRACIKTIDEKFDDFLNKSLVSTDPKQRESIIAEINEIVGFPESYTFPFDPSMEFTEKQIEFVNTQFTDFAKLCTMHLAWLSIEYIKTRLENENIKYCAK
jgi:hypothetical protein